jgi:hypothetical protein
MAITAKAIEASLNEINALQEKFMAAQEDLEAHGLEVQVLAGALESLVNSTGTDLLKGLTRRARELGGGPFSAPLIIESERPRRLVIDGNSIVVATPRLIGEKIEIVDPAGILSIAPIAAGLLQVE